MSDKYVLTGTSVETGETEALASGHDILFLVRIADQAKTLNAWTDLQVRIPTNTGAKHDG